MQNVGQENLGWATDGKFRLKLERSHAKGDAGVRNRISGRVTHANALRHQKMYYFNNLKIMGKTESAYIVHSDNALPSLV